MAFRQKSHWDYSDDQFLEKFISGSLNPGLFSHEAHIRLAYIFISRIGEERAIDETCSAIKGYVDHLKIEGKYHETITVVAVKLVAKAMRDQSYDDIRAFLDSNPDLINRFKEIVQSHYSFDVFNDSSARAQFVEPDLLPFSH